MPALHLITGASSGVGALLTTRLAASGATVAAVARSRDKLEALAAAHPGRIIPVVADVADWEAAATAVERLERDHGPVTALVNNAAIFAMTPFVGHKPADIQRLLATNIEGTLAWTHAVASSSSLIASSTRPRSSGGGRASNSQQRCP